jgi:UDP-xylose/UDP-N-acetylglucosamine transporter B4
MPFLDSKSNGAIESELPLLSDEHVRERREEEPLPAKALRLAGRIAAETASQWIAVGVMLGLIFGGCCSNVSS